MATRITAGAAIVIGEEFLDFFDALVLVDVEQNAEDDEGDAKDES